MKRNTEYHNALTTIERYAEEAQSIMRVYKANKSVQAVLVTNKGDSVGLMDLSKQERPEELMQTFNTFLGYCRGEI